MITAFTSPPPTFKYAVSNGASEAKDTGSGCASPTVQTPFLTWTKFYANDTSNVTNIYWYAPSGQTGSLFVYTGLIQGGFYEQPTRDAIQTWYNALKSRVPSGHYLRLVPREDFINWNADLVQVVVDYSGLDYTAGAYTSYGTVYAPGTLTTPNGNHATSDGSYVAGSLIRFLDAPIARDAGWDPTEIYKIALHEMGHVLGLDHNPEKSSIMYPDTTSCYYYGSWPIPSDTQSIMNHYDPQINADQPRLPPTPCGGLLDSSVARSAGSVRRTSVVINCGLTPLSAARSTGSVAAGGSASTPARFGPPSLSNSPSLQSSPPQYSRDGGLPNAPRLASSPANFAPASSNTGGRPSVERFMRSLHWVHGQSEGKIDVRKLSPSSITAASSSVILAHPVRNVTDAKRGPNPVVVTHEYVVDGVVDDVAAAIGDRQMAIGEHVFVDELMAYQDVPYADDPTPTGETVLFLRKIIGHRARAAGQHIAYQLTAPMVSKWSMTSDGRVYLTGGSTTRAAREINGRTLSSVRASMSKSHGLSAMSSLRSGILSDRALSLQSDIANLRINPELVLVEHARFDGAARLY